MTPTTQPRTAYDEVPYDSRPILGTSPGRLALASFLHGGPLPPVAGYRALEIGCNSAGNLLPLAFYAPGSEFVGLDYAETALAAGRAAAAEVGVSNMRLEWADLRQPLALDGPFHYVIAHGVFSWVDAGVRARILDLCGRCLAPDGVVYLSHNVDAGWRIRGLVRDVVLAGVADLPSAAEQLRRARELAADFADVVDGSQSAFHALLASEFRRVTGSPDGYLAHETLSPENVAFRHSEVTALLAGHGFSYVADALYDRPEGRTPPGLREALDGLGHSGPASEQLADVIGCRAFRSSVFCRTDAVRPAADAEREALAALDDLFVASSEDDPDDGVPMDAEFSLPADAQLAAGLLLLATDWPRGMAVPEWIARSRDLVDGEPMDEGALRRRLLAMHRRGRVALRANAPYAAVASSGTPHRLARQQAARGHDLTTPAHEAIGLDPEDRAVVTRLADRVPDADIVRVLAAFELDDEAARHLIAETRTTLDRWGLTEPGE